jgi:5'-deoxynucleotidase YfbR-like HD superfamily hydrolase
VHDLHEGHIDDVVHKTDARRAEEAQWDSKISDIYSKEGDHTTGSLITEYNEKSSPEAKFIKALDHLEALLTMLYADRTDKIRNREASNDKIMAGVVEISPLLAQITSLVNERLVQRRDEIGQQELDF